MHQKQAWPWPRYLLWFSNSVLPEFRYSELFAVARKLGVPIHWEKMRLPEEPFLPVRVPSECALQKLLSRLVSVHGCVEVWGEGDTLEELHQDVRRNEKLWSKYRDDVSLSFSVDVTSFHKRMTLEERVQRIDGFQYLKFEGKINLSAPDLKLHCIEFHDNQHNQTSPVRPLRYWFGRWVSDGIRHLITKHSLKTRNFIANTSMDPELALIMANVAHVGAGSFVYDPFVGSGSILVAAAEMGAMVMGADIDYLTVHGKSKPSRCNERVRKEDESIWNNLRQYGLESRYVDVLVADAAFPLWRESLKLDAILADPPYGIREKTARIGTQKEVVSISEEQRPCHIPQKIGYALDQVLNDLLSFSVRHLKIGGHVVFWIPASRRVPSCLPSHPCLQLSCMADQPLTRASYRSMICFRKVREPSSEKDVPCVHFSAAYRQMHVNFVDDLVKRYSGKR